MARIRTIKPKFWIDEDLSSLPESTHMLAAQLLNYSDDDGYFNANPKLIKAEISPLREPSVSIQESLMLLERIRFIEIGIGEDGKKYGRIRTFRDHQKINRPTPSKIKGIHIDFGTSSHIHETCTENSVSPHTRNKEQGIRKGNEEEERISDHRLRDDRPDEKGVLQGQQFPSEPQWPEVHKPKAAEDEFSAVWLQWPRKVAKAAALKAWVKARKDTDFNIIIAGLEQFVLDYDADRRPEDEKQQFCPHFASWLNSERWRDYDVAPQPDRSGMTKAEKYRQIILEAGLTPLE